jgi:hypothetical protein
MKVTVGEGFGDDGFDPIFTERSHERMSDGDLVQPIDRSHSIDSALPHEDCEPPTLVSEFDKLGVCDGPPSLA